MITFPNIDPIAISLGPIAIRWYALAYISGILLAWWGMVRLLHAKTLWAGDTPPAKKLDVDDYIVWATLAIILGGRIGYVLVYDTGLLFSDPLGVLQVWRGGMSFHGGLLGVILATLLFCWKRKIALMPFADLVASVSPIGLFFGRVANFINGELWGRPSDAPWAMVFPNADLQPRHPSQIYEAALEGLLLLAVLQFLVHRFRAFKTPGVITGTFLIGYAIVRMMVEALFREPDVQMPDLPLGLTAGLILSLPMVILGIGFILYGRRGR